MRKFLFSDKMHVGRMLRDRGLETDEALRTLPEVGFIVFEDLAPTAVAAGFLRKVEGGLGLIDSFVSNPAAPGTDRNEALDRITTALVDEAIHMELRGIVAFSMDQNTVQRSLRHGFSAWGHVVVTKDLK